MPKLYIFVVITIMFFISSNSFAQNEVDTLSIRDFYMDFAIPDITAFSILGIEPAQISKPGNVREFALGITNFVNQNGDLRAGLALEWAPLITLNPEKTNWRRQNSGRIKFEWKNLTTSIATTSDSTNVRLGWAFRFSPIDFTNPLNDKDWTDSISNYFYSLDNQNRIKKTGLVQSKMEYRNRVSVKFLEIIKVPLDLLPLLSAPLDITQSFYLDSLKSHYTTNGLLYDREVITMNILGSIKELFESEGFVENFSENKHLLEDLSREFTDLFYQTFSGYSLEEKFNTHILKMKEDYKKNNWNKWTLQITAGGTADSPEATVSEIQGDYFTFALSSGFPLLSENWFKGTAFNDFMRNHSQVILHARGQRSFIQDSVQNNVIFLGSRVLVGNYNRRLSIEVGYVSLSNQTTNITQSGIRYSVGAELMISDNYWLEFAIGGQTFENNSAFGILPRFAFRHALGNESRFNK